MSVDDRLHSGLRPGPEYMPETRPELMDVLVNRVRRRRRVRGLVVAAVAAGACLVVVVAIPQAISGSQSVKAPAGGPTATGTTQQDDWQPPDRTSPIDGRSWTAQVLSREDRLATLKGTDLNDRAASVFARADMQGRMSAVILWQGQFSATTWAHDGLAPSATAAGTFHVEGDNLVVTLADTSGRTVFEWRKPDPDHLELTFVSTTVPSLYGAPADVFFTMWCATPFTLRLGY